MAKFRVSEEQKRQAVAITYAVVNVREARSLGDAEAVRQGEAFALSEARKAYGPEWDENGAEAAILHLAAA